MRYPAGGGYGCTLRCAQCRQADRRALFRHRCRRSLDCRILRVPRSFRFRSCPAWSTSFHSTSCCRAAAGRRSREVRTTPYGSRAATSSSSPEGRRTFSVPRRAPGARPTRPPCTTVRYNTHLPFEMLHGGEGPHRTRFLCGFLGCDARPFNPLLSALPDVMVVSRPPDRELWITDLFKAALTEGRERRAGSETILAKLSELMFVQVLREHIERLPEESRAGWRGCATHRSARRFASFTGGPRSPGRSISSSVRSGSRDPSLRADFPPTWAFRPCSTLPAGACSLRSATSRTPWSASPRPGPKSATSPRPRSTGPSKKLSASRPARGGAAGPGRTGLCRLHPPSQRTFDDPPDFLYVPRHPARGSFCGCGGTGRRTGFRFQRRKAWRFKSSHPHHRPPARTGLNVLGLQRHPNGISPCRLPRPSMKA